MIILSVESSCDETSVAITRNGKEVLSNVVFSQISIHKKFGGIVPEIASRNHITHMIETFEEAIKLAKINVSDINLVAVTNGPGLVGSLLVGVNAATSFAYANNIKIIGVNHLLGHIYASNIEHDMKFPLVVLLISGGHTELLYMKDHLDVKLLGTTLDDAVGEAYDKVGRILGFSYPGGPHIDKSSKLGKNIYKLPRPMYDDKTYNFSFSGLKSAVVNLIHNKKQKNEIIDVENICKSFQETVIETLLGKTQKAVSDFNVKQLIISGGVAANEGIKNRFIEEFSDIEVIIPNIKYCTDNAAMIGIAAYYQYNKNKNTTGYVIEVDSSIDF